MKKINVLLIFSLMIVILVGCTEESTDTQNPSDSEFVEYGVAGEIVEIKDDKTSSTMTILVKGDEDNGATYTEGWVTIIDSTKIYMSEEAEKSDLELGMYVNVFFDGPVAESFPVQGTAKQINVVDKNNNNVNVSEEDE
jgi:hypothetical protein